MMRTAEEILKDIYSKQLEFEDYTNLAKEIENYLESDAPESEKAKILDVSESITMIADNIEAGLITKEEFDDYKQ